MAAYINPDLHNKLILNGTMIDEAEIPEDDLEEEYDLEEEFPQKDRSKSSHFSRTERKARRKERLVAELYNGDYKAPHGYYRKGKIHCSCPSCSAKTNTSINKSKGGVDPHRKFRSRLSVTNERYGKKNYKASDKRKIDSMLSQMLEFQTNIPEMRP